MADTNSIIIILDECIKLLTLGNVPKAKGHLEELMEKLERDAKRAEKEYKVQELNPNLFSAEIHDAVLKLNETIRFVNDHTVRR